MRTFSAQRNGSRGSRAGKGRARRPAGMEPCRPLFRHGRAGAEGRHRARRARFGGVRGPLEGHAGGRSRKGRCRPARRRTARFRGAGGTDRPHRVLCRAGLCRRHVGPAARQALWRHPGEDDGRQRASAVLRAGAQPDRRRTDREGARRRPAVRPLPAVGHRSQERQALPARGPHRAAVPREVGDRARRLEPPLRRDDDRAALRRRRRGDAAWSRR